MELVICVCLYCVLVCGKYLVCVLARYIHKHIRLSLETVQFSIVELVMCMCVFIVCGRYIVCSIAYVVSSGDIHEHNRG